MSYEPRIGLALGSGAARGWAHIGVIRALEEFGLRPSVVCGTSMGALVGAAYAAGRLTHFEDWARSLDRSTVLGMFDVSLRGGLIQAKKVFDYMSTDIPDVDIEELGLTFGAVATDLDQGSEVWIRSGNLRDALRASVALPGLISPARDERRGRWLVDGGLVNPVPVSLCRALGADVVIAVELSGEVLTHPIAQFSRSVPPLEAAVPDDADASSEQTAAGTDDDRDGSEVVDPELEAAGGNSVFDALSDFADGLYNRLTGKPSRTTEIRWPSVYEVISKSLLVMQVRITRSTMAGDPPELHVLPRLQQVGILDFDKADLAIPEGHRAVEVALATQADFHRPALGTPPARRETDAAIGAERGTPGRAAGEGDSSAKGDEDAS